MLKDEEEGVEGEVETTEIVFDSGELIEVPDPEYSPIKANSGSDLVSLMLNFPELEGVEPKASTTLDFTAKKSVREVTEETPPFEAVQGLPEENLEVEAIGDLPEEKPSEETNVKWLKEPTIVEIKDVKEEAPTPKIEMVEKLQEQKRSNDRLRIFPMTNHALKLVQHRYRSTLSCATADANEAQNRDGLRKTDKDPGMNMADVAALVASMPIQWKELKIVGEIDSNQDLEDFPRHSLA
ncbi:hypothetical protein QYF36_006371 [Acer negundo]|nr:hypothetical protein QYF36_006371 [Acer negundo]